MRAGGEIDKKVLLMKISSYTVYPIAMLLLSAILAILH